ncbi:bet1-like protein At4g14600 isoform X2 [Tripterygium wilfordii]|uniref:bet1-like protein At4g14600 isoform X2 n=1 Tax=Tripterygium wilfordii TaxID=458696 RepID=UPI0018F7FFE1|nr:bet1-like protein At4g14600 isoform X2 [Tripterygium wilfordii]
MANPYRSREGLSSRPVAGSDEIQLRIDPVHGELDEEISGLHRQVKQLKNVAQEIETEARVQNDIISDMSIYGPSASKDEIDVFSQLHVSCQRSS